MVLTALILLSSGFSTQVHVLEKNLPKSQLANYVVLDSVKEMFIAQVVEIYTR